MSRRSRNSAARIVAAFERVVEDAAEKGAGHPDLFDWHEERLAVARERVILYLMGETPRVRMPEQPRIEYDR